ncbi:unnamed protein product [Litomosoides sigmodontis]|uniref:LIM interaction domain-containing protein n=1 Tax=Litomosoides sigmodontis TaxID=42156 RepID=A0A3P6SPN9_LITSI|nr:unnamed protein product [Litomosoides sigmodontis]
MPRRKANENGTTSAAVGTARPRARRSKKDVGGLEPKLEMVQGMYDSGRAPSAMQTVPMMHNHNGMIPIHDDSGPMSSHHVYTPPTGSMGAPPPPPPPPEYYQAVPPGYQPSPLGPPPGPTQQAPPPHQFIEPEPPQSPFVGQPSHLQQHNHMIMRYRHVAPMGMPNHQQGPPPSQLEFRLHEMNRRLFIFSNSGIQEKDHAQWWDAFAHEFFDDDAKMSFLLFDDQAPGHHHRYTIGRLLIPRYFRSIFESGVKEMFYVIRTPSREQAGGPWTIVLDCDNVLLVSKHEKPILSEVHTDCKLMCEFAFDDTYGYRIRQWNIELRHCQEFVLRDVNMLQDSETQEKLKMNITRTGMTQITLNYLKLCVILEPMQVLMSQSKSHNIPPRESLKQTLFQTHAKMQQYQQHQQQQQMAMNAMGGMNPSHVLPPTPVEEPTSKKPRKRTRKTATGASATSNAKKKNNSPPSTNAANFSMNSHFPLQYQDVMVVGEPSMMGGEYGEEDERTISRVENTQFDPSAMQNSLPSMNHQMSTTMSAIAGPPPPQTYMPDFELTSIGGWGVNTGSQAPSSAAPPAACGTPLGVSTPITACDPQQT